MNSYSDIQELLLEILEYRNGCFVTKHELNEILYKFGFITQSAYEDECHRVIRDHIADLVEYGLDNGFLIYSSSKHRGYKLTNNILEMWQMWWETISRIKALKKKADSIMKVIKYHISIKYYGNRKTYKEGDNELHS